MKAKHYVVKMFYARADRDFIHGLLGDCRPRGNPEAGAGFEGGLHPQHPQCNRWLVDPAAPMLPVLSRKTFMTG